MTEKGLPYLDDVERNRFLGAGTVAHEIPYEERI
jgi:hypothetical protein